MPTPLSGFLTPAQTQAQIFLSSPSLTNFSSGNIGQAINNRIAVTNPIPRLQSLIPTIPQKQPINWQNILGGVKSLAESGVQIFSAVQSIRSPSVSYRDIEQSQPQSQLSNVDNDQRGSTGGALDWSGIFDIFNTDTKRTASSLPMAQDNTLMFALIGILIIGFLAVKK